MCTFLNWRCFKLEDGRKDARPVVVYKIVNENVVITKIGRFKPPFTQLPNMHFSSFIITPCKTQQKQQSLGGFSGTRQYLTGTRSHGH